MSSPLKIKNLFVLAIYVSVVINVSTVQKTTGILWDNYGVPRIFGNTTTEMYYAYGWSQMHSSVFYYLAWHLHYVSDGYLIHQFLRKNNY
jgi:acyl-homoserine lactone acylase PvdQ